LARRGNQVAIPAFGLSRYRKARRAFKITATSIASCSRAPAQVEDSRVLRRSCPDGKSEGDENALKRDGARSTRNIERRGERIEFIDPRLERRGYDRLAEEPGR
jgi:hypothetical protein